MTFKQHFYKWIGFVLLVVGFSGVPFTISVCTYLWGKALPVSPLEYTSFNYVPVFIVACISAVCLLLNFLIHEYYWNKGMNEIKCMQARNNQLQAEIDAFIAKRK